MELIPHIDLIEPERIEALFSDPGNYAWRAVRASSFLASDRDLGNSPCRYTVPSS